MISYNLHGFNQGYPGIKELMIKLQPDIIMVQEHWLTPDNLGKLSAVSDDYLVCGSSAMIRTVSAGPLIGRPFGGTAILINKKHMSGVEFITSQDRFTAVKVHNWLLITVYMPCVGTSQRDLLCSDILSELQVLLDCYRTCDFLIGGDFNTDLDSNTSFSAIVNSFICRNNLNRCDNIIPISNRNTYVDESTNVCSAIDYILSSNHDKIAAFNIIDLDINLSDHLPIIAVCRYDLKPTMPSPLQCHSRKPNTATEVKYFRWDHAPLPLYYEYTRLQLSSIKLGFQAQFLSHFKDKRGRGRMTHITMLTHPGKFQEIQRPLFRILLTQR